MNAHDHHPHPARPLSEGPEHPEDGVIYLEDDGRVRIWDKPENVKKLLKVFFIICGLFFLLDFVLMLFPGTIKKLFGVYKYSAFKDGKLPFEQWPGFYCIYGLVACVVLVLIAKQLRKVLMRDERYYEDRNL